MTINIPSLEQLKRALHINEAIEKLQDELSSIFGGGGAKRGRKPGRRAAVQAFSDETAVAPKRRGRGPGKKTIAKAAIASGDEIATVPTKKAGKKKAKRVMSPEAREKIAAAQRLRWAKTKKAKY